MKTILKNKPLTNIEKLNKINPQNYLIINPPNTFNKLLYTRHDQNKFKITAFNPLGTKAITAVKEIALIPLSFLTYKLLTPKRQIIATQKPKKNSPPSPTSKSNFHAQHETL